MQCSNMGQELLISVLDPLFYQSACRIPAQALHLLGNLTPIRGDEPSNKFSAVLRSHFLRIFRYYHKASYFQLTQHHLSKEVQTGYCLVYCPPPSKPYPNFSCGTIGGSMQHFTQKYYKIPIVACLDLGSQKCEIQVLSK